MSQFNLNKNLVQLRYQKGITQEKLADFLGVSKASVSKWETGQSMPDIAHLPKLAAFYDVTIDEMMGYESTLTLKEVKNFYLKFSEAFAKEKFEKVLADVRDFIRMYYACDIALLQMALLLMNHLSITPSDVQAEVMEEIVQLCLRVQEKSEDVEVIRAAALYLSSIELLRGNPQVVIENMEYRKNPMNITGGEDVLLIQAYQAAGRLDDSREWNQVSIYRDIISLMQNSTYYLMNNLQNKEVAEATINRMEQVVAAYELKTLHVNSYLQFVYIKAMYHATYRELQKAMHLLEEFVEAALDFLKNDATLHGDAYFDLLDGYLLKAVDYVMLPRDVQTVISTLGQQLMHPVFADLFETDEFKELIGKCSSES